MRVGLLALALAGVVAQAATVNLAWDGVVDPRVTAYEIAFGNQSGVYSNYAQVPSTQDWASIETEDDTYIAVRSVGAVGAYSAWSNEVIWLAQLDPETTQPFAQIGIHATYEILGNAMATDTFDGADGTALTTHDSNWSAGSFGSISNLQLDGSGNVEHTANWRSSSDFYDTGHAADQESEIGFVGVSGGGDDRNVAVRMSASTLGYSAVLSGISGGNFTICYLQKNGSWLSTMATGLSIAVTADTVLRITVEGTSSAEIHVYIDDVEAGSGYTDSSSPITSGDPGFYINEAPSADQNKISYWTDNADAAAASNMPPSSGFIKYRHLVVR